MKKALKGTGVAIVTPFHKHGTVDFTSLGKLIEHLVTNGVNYIVTLGTTGETATLSEKEKLAVTDFVVDAVAKRVPIVLGLGGNDTQKIVDQIKTFNFDGIDAVLSVAPYYNKPQQRGLFYHFKSIEAVLPVPMLIYNVPSRTGVNISAETTLKLAAEVSGIIGIKEASGNMMQCMQIIKDKPKDFLVISGEDALTLPLIAAGADGVISVVANAFPKEFSEMVQLALSGNIKKAKELHYTLFNFTNTIFEDGSPSGIKAALEVLEICQNNLRLPLVKVNKQTFSTIQNIVKEIIG
ncbi:MAG: 4-hydroxy-tetrahydrodipicolinate synthase [Bacteroidales bacterium]